MSAAPAVPAVTAAEPQCASADTEGVHSRPRLTFNDLIRLALLSTPDNQANLAQIYQYIQTTYPYYNKSKACRHWKNSVRHTLCKSHEFRKVDDPATRGQPYRRGSAVWTLNQSDPTSGTSHEPRQVCAKPKPYKSQVRPSSLESMSSGQPYRRGSAVWTLNQSDPTSGTSHEPRQVCAKPMPYESQVRKSSLESTSSGQPYAVWTLNQSDPTSGTSHEPRQVCAKPMPYERQVRPSSLESTSSDYLYPWQLDRAQTPLAGMSSNMAANVPESVTPSMEGFLKPWTASPEQLALGSHLEAPQPEEVGSPPSEILSDRAWPEGYWLYGRDHSADGGAAEGGPLGTGAWTGSTCPSPLPVLTNQQSPQSHYLYTDGVYLYSM